MSIIKRFCHNLHRRSSLRFSGYVRPPFMLVIRRRPGKKLLSNTFFKPENPGPPKDPPTLSTSTRQEIVNLLAPIMKDEEKRRALLTRALGLDSPVLRRIHFKPNNVESFIQDMIDALIEYGEIKPGKQALWVLLEVVKDRVNVVSHPRIDALRRPIDALPPPRACYLWPDRLRWHFFMITLLYMIILGIDGAWVPVAFVAVFLILIIPWFTYSWQRSPVLESLWWAWPPFINKWFKGLTDEKFDWRSRIKAYIPPVKEEWDAVYWSPQGLDHRFGQHPPLHRYQPWQAGSPVDCYGPNDDHSPPQGSPRDSLLRAAITEMFRADDDEVEISWRHKAWMRWLFYWCAPVWGSYIALLVLLIPKAYDNKIDNMIDNIINSNTKHNIEPDSFFYFHEQFVPASLTLYFLVWMWVLFGVIIISREAKKLDQWSWLKQDNRSYVPSLVYRHLKDISSGFMILSEPSLKVVFRVCTKTNRLILIVLFW